MKFFRLRINIARQNIFEHYVFDKVGFIVFFVVKVFHRVQRNGKHGGDVLRQFVRSLYKNDIIHFNAGTDNSVCIPVGKHKVVHSHNIGKAVAHAFSDKRGIAANRDGTRLVKNTDNSVRRIFHLLDNVLI